MDSFVNFGTYRPEDADRLKTELERNGIPVKVVYPGTLIGKESAGGQSFTALTLLVQDKNFKQAEKLRDEQVIQSLNKVPPLSKFLSAEMKIFGIVVILMTFAAGAFYLWNTSWIGLSQQQEASRQDKTANWKTYQNKFYGFEFKYPGEDKVNELGPLGKDEAKFPMSNVIFIQASRADGGADNIFGIIVPDQEFIRKSGEDYTHFITKPGVCGKQDPKSESQISSEYTGIGSYSGKKVTEVFPTAYPNRKTFRIFYCIAHSVNPLIIFTPQGSEVGRQDEDPDFKTFEQIFSTFQFLQ